MSPLFAGTPYPAQPPQSYDGGTYEGFRALLLTYLDTDSADLSADLVDTLIGFGEARINREVRCREMESPLALAVNNGTAAVPADYLELKNARLFVGGQLFKIERMDLDQFETMYRYPAGTTGSGSTQGYYASTVRMARDGDTFVFGPGLADGTPVTGGYYVRFTPLKDRPFSLTDPDSTSYQRLYANHPDLYLYAALEDAEQLIGRPLRAQNWRGRYGELKTMLMTQSQRERFSGGPLRIRAR